MKLNWIVVIFVALFFFIGSFLILQDQYLKIGIWFQFPQILHHETFAIASFIFAFGVLIGALIVSIKK